MAQNKWLPVVIIGGVIGGAWLLMRNKVTKIIDILKNPAAFAGKTVTLEGTVAIYDFVPAIADGSGSVGAQFSLPIVIADGVYGPYINHEVRIVGVIYMMEVPVMPAIEVKKISLI